MLNTFKQFTLVAQPPAEVSGQYPYSFLLLGVYGAVFAGVTSFSAMERYVERNLDEFVALHHQLTGVTLVVEESPSAELFRATLNSINPELFASKKNEWFQACFPSVKCEQLDGISMRGVKRPTFECDVTVGKVASKTSAKTSSKISSKISSKSSSQNSATTLAKSSVKGSSFGYSVACNPTCPADNHDDLVALQELWLTSVSDNDNGVKNIDTILKITNSLIYLIKEHYKCQAIGAKERLFNQSPENIFNIFA